MFLLKKFKLNFAYFLFTPSFLIELSTITFMFIKARKITFELINLHHGLIMVEADEISLAN